MKSVIVTGGAQGIGKATARAFLTAGYAVTIADHDAEAGTETCEEYAPLGVIRFALTDVAAEEQVIALMSETAARFGGIDVLVNNAGIFTPTPFESQSMAQWQQVIGINLTGAMLCAKYATPHLRARRGVIINVASTRAHMSEPHTEAYAASKGGLVALSHALAVSLGPDVRVNCVSPGWIDVRGWKKRSVRETTPLREEDHRQHPVGRVGQPEDVAALIQFLADDAAGFITGQEFVIDGGMTRKMIYAE